MPRPLGLLNEKEAALNYFVYQMKSWFRTRNGRKVDPVKGRLGITFNGQVAALGPKESPLGQFICISCDHKGGIKGPSSPPIFYW
jgi:hypothetical protein